MISNISLPLKSFFSITLVLLTGLTQAMECPKEGTPVSSASQSSSSVQPSPSASVFGAIVSSNDSQVSAIARADSKVSESTSEEITLASSSSSQPSLAEWPEIAFLEDIAQSDKGLKPLTQLLLKRAIQKYKMFNPHSRMSVSEKEAKEEKEALSNYSINLIWLTRDTKQAYIFPNEFKRSELDVRELLALVGTDDLKKVAAEARINLSAEEAGEALTIGMKNTFLQSCIQWGLANPNVAVNIWYDSAFVTKEAVENTRKLIHDTWRKFSNIKNPITLKDIRELDTVRANPRIFPDNPSRGKGSIEIPLFYQVDLVRIIIALHLLAQQPKTQPYYFVYADFDVLPIPQKSLFDAQTVTSLNNYGMVLAVGPENYFQIISNNKDLLEALDFAFVKFNLQRAIYLIENNLLSDMHTKALLGEAPFKSYQAMFEYFVYLQGKGKLKVNTDHGILVDYDKDVHGLEPFNVVHYKQYANNFLQLEEKRAAERSSPPQKKLFGGHKNKLGYWR